MTPEVVGEALLAALLAVVVASLAWDWLEYGTQGMAFGTRIVRTLGEVRALGSAGSDLTYEVYCLRPRAGTRSVVGVKIVSSSGGDSGTSAVHLTREEATNLADLLEDSMGGRLKTMAHVGLGTLRASTGETAASLTVEDSRALARLLREAAQENNRV